MSDTGGTANVCFIVMTLPSHFGDQNVPIISDFGDIEYRRDALSVINNNDIEESERSNGERYEAAFRRSGFIDDALRARR